MSQPTDLPGGGLPDEAPDGELDEQELEQLDGGTGAAGFAILPPEVNSGRIFGG